ncbi:hypothetical protein NECAME_01840 [Necator americanus]|uniref:Uncharacterized protein n=1 Tax=Necator americanus TaxID=51031 RepID=W2TPH9_NECAM|nr:hypothetical protein NECAME_01840 [Necator americanus]ETN83041.1 hypothetical protein NECAME_01840 [Necator americanus]
MLSALFRGHCRSIQLPYRALSRVHSGVVVWRPGIDSSCIDFPTLCKDLVFVDKFAIRWIRSRGNDRDNGHHSSGNDSHSTEQKEESSNSGDQNPEKPKVDPALLRKLRIYVLIVGGLSFVMSFLILSQMATGQGQMEGLQPEFLSRQGIDMKTFVTSYLRAGEAYEPVVVVAYSKDAQQFWADIRKEEDDMGISLSDGVQIDLFRGMTTFRMIELALGVLIIAWLLTQYGRLMRQRFLAKKQKNNGSGGGDSK